MSAAFISILPLSARATVHIGSTCDVPRVHPTSRSTRRATMRKTTSPMTMCEGMSRPEGDESNELSIKNLETAMLTMTAMTLGLFGDMGFAHAVPDAWKEAFKSKPASLVHPGVMWLMLAGTLYTFYLGYKSSTVRSADAATRKELLKEKFADRHFKTSSFIFATTTIITFSGMANTYTRAGKLFPGPHLYAGLGIVAAMSVMNSLVPYMQKGKDWARNSHFALAFLVTGLFGWQAKSGMVIVGKLLGWK